MSRRLREASRREGLLRPYPRGEPETLLPSVLTQVSLSPNKNRKARAEVVAWPVGSPNRRFAVPRQLDEFPTRHIEFSTRLFSRLTRQFSRLNRLIEISNRRIEFSNPLPAVRTSVARLRMGIFGTVIDGIGTLPLRPLRTRALHEVCAIVPVTVTIRL